MRSRRAHRPSSRWPAELVEEGRLRVSTQVLQELFVTLTLKEALRCSVEEGLAVLESLSAWRLIILDYSVIRAAAGLAGQVKISFWDALIVVAASRSGAAVLYTEDLNDGQEILGVRISNPFAA
jgi:predicted nucleic acid-binding protein